MFVTPYLPGGKQSEIHMVDQAKYRLKVNASAFSFSAYVFGVQWLKNTY